MNYTKIVKIAKLFAKLSDIATDKGILVIDGELEVGANAAIETEEGEFIEAPDGDYIYEEKTIVIAEGKVAEIKEAEAEVEETVEEAPEVIEEATELEETVEEVIEEVAEDAEETVEDEKDLRIKDLEAMLAQKDAEITALNAKIAELENAAMAPVEAPVELSKTVKTEKKQYTVKDNPALKYFQN